MLIGITGVFLCSCRGRFIAAAKQLKASTEKNASRLLFSLEQPACFFVTQMLSLFPDYMSGTPLCPLTAHTSDVKA